MLRPRGGGRAHPAGEIRGFPADRVGRGVPAQRHLEDLRPEQPRRRRDLPREAERGPLRDHPPHVVNAFVAAEDANFFKHKGVDYFAIVRAIGKDVLSGGFAQGASTITQQTVKSLFLTPEKSIGRKLKELILAYRIEKKLSKEEILYLYLNQIYLGDGAYGVEAAAQTYFSRGVSTLTVAEGALLAGLAQAPTRYSPRGHIDKARARQRYVLRRMAEVGFLDKDAAEKAYGARLALAPPSTFRSKAAYFLEHDEDS